MLMGDFIRILDINLSPGFDPAIHLRDLVHTTPLGGIYYASIIASNIIRMHEDGVLKSGFRYPQVYYKDCSLRIPSVSKKHVSSGYEKCHDISILVRFDRSYMNPSLVFDNLLGPYSPVVGIVLDGNTGFICSFWDPWCHFVRQNYTGLALPVTSTGDTCTVTIYTSSYLPLYATCGNNFDFTRLSDRYLMIKTVFSIGGVIEDIAFNCYQ